MALSFQSQAGADAVWGSIEDAKEIAKSNLIQLMRAESVDSSGLNYDPLENDIFSEENVLSMPSIGNLPKILSELTVFNHIFSLIALFSMAIERNHHRAESPNIRVFDYKGALNCESVIYSYFCLEGLHFAIGRDLPGAGTRERPSEPRDSAIHPQADQ